MSPANELGVSDLRKECDPSILDFKASQEPAAKTEMLGQERALRAIDFGLNCDGEWFNIYVSGPQGSGRNTMVLQAVEKAAAQRKVPDDICYLYNFEKEDEPKFLKLPAGRGCEFKQDMSVFVRDLENEIKNSFLSEDYEKHKKAIIDKFEEDKEDLDEDLGQFARSKGFMIKQGLTGFVVLPVYKGRQLTTEKFEKLSDEEKGALKGIQQEIDNKLFETSRKLKELQRKSRTEMGELDKDVILFAIGHLIEDLKRKYAEFPEVIKHLEDIKTDILKNVDIFKKDPDAKEPLLLAGMSGKDKHVVLNNYQVNLLVDNCRAKGAPVVAEHNPTYYNLTGYVEYRAQFGVLNTDFMLIKPGALLKANGGYLIVQAYQLLRDYFAWDALKKIIRYRKVKIENLAEQYGLIPTTGLKPQAIPVDIKVIIIGSPWLYYLLYFYDEDFRKYFKVKLDFDGSVKKLDSLTQRYANFVYNKSREDKLLPLEKEAVARVLDYASRLVSHKEKMTTRLQEIAEIIREADYWARKEKAASIGAGHIKLALEEKVYRSNMIEQKIHELFEENVLFMDTDGSRTGQINGLSVMQLGEHSFGIPSRITVSTFMGKGNIVNIEREAKLSGKIHSKGVLILSGYLGNKFAQDKPLALQANICFEQLYEPVEGDSASSTELYCLLSSLAELPLRQDIAVTGSVDQLGRIQPIGGVNEKIEGFYAVCKIKGLTGKQGVMIPRANVQNLMLKDEVVEAVRQKRFHIYAVETVEEGIEILTGQQAGQFQAGKGYTRDSVFQKVDKKLSEYARLAQNFSKPQKS